MCSSDLSRRETELRMEADPVAMLLRIRELSWSICLRHRISETAPDAGRDAKRDERIGDYGSRIMQLLGRLEDLGYDPPPLDADTIAALHAHGQPASLTEWRDQ